MGMTSATSKAIYHTEALINMVVCSLSRVEGGGTTVPKNGIPHIRSPGRATVVGQDCQDIQFCPINTTTYRSSNLD